jgi:hypothetical protein
VEGGGAKQLSVKRGSAYGSHLNGWKSQLSGVAGPRFEPTMMGALSHSVSRPAAHGSCTRTSTLTDHIVINFDETRPFSDRGNDWIQGANGAFVSATGGDTAAAARRTKCQDLRISNL